MKPSPPKHVPERTFKCELCPKSFAAAKHLNLHYTVTHGRKVSKNVSEGSFKCELCPRSFAAAKSLNIHYTVTHERKVSKNISEGSVKCELCQKSFKNLKLHMFFMHKGEAKCASDRKLFDTSQQQQPYIIPSELTKGMDDRDNDETPTSSQDFSTEMETIYTLCSDTELRDDEIKIPKSPIQNLKKPIKHKVLNVPQKTSDWSCEWCKRAFVAKEKLGSHILIHYYNELKHTLSSTSN